MKARYLWIALFLSFSVDVQSTAYSQSNACNTSDFKTCSSEDLLNVMSDILDNSNNPDLDLVQKIETELVKRKSVDPTYKFFAKTEYLPDLDWTYMILSALRSKHVDDLIKPHATSDLTLRAYFANSYFAETGQRFALANLNKNYFQYEIPSFAWADTVRLFGKYKCFQAKNNLISTVDAAEENLAEASIESLEILYPETKKKVDSLGSTKRIIEFYTDYVKKH